MNYDCVGCISYNEIAEKCTTPLICVDNGLYSMKVDHEMENEMNSGWEYQKEVVIDSELLQMLNSYLLKNKLSYMVWEEEAFAIDDCGKIIFFGNKLELREFLIKELGIKYE